MLWHGVNRTWIVCYTLWNLAFVYLNLPFLIGSHIVVLLVPLLIGLKSPRRWLQAHLHMLCIVLLLQFTFDFHFKGPLVNSAHWNDERIGLAANLGMFAAISVLMTRRYVWRRLGWRARPMPEAS